MVMGCLISTNSAQLLKHESPVIWRKTDKILLTGVKAWDLTVAVKSPCTLRGITDARVSTELTRMCQQQYDNMVPRPMNEFCRQPISPDREKRQIGVEFVAGVAGEYVITSLVETIRGWFHGSTDTNDQRLAIIAGEMSKLQLYTAEAYALKRAQSSTI